MKAACLFLICATTCFAGSWPKPSAPFYHAATAKQAALHLADMRAAGYYVDPLPVAFTGSMRPYINGGETLVLEAYHGQPLAPGMVIVFNRDPKATRCLHMIAAMNRRAVYASGINNRYSDGWVTLDRISWIVREIVKAPTSGLR